MNEENVQAPPEEPGLFDDYVQHVDASVGNRFVNFLVDNLFMRFALSYATGYLIGNLLAYTAPDFLIYLTSDGETSFRMILLGLIIGYANYILYYSFCETAFKGYTLGKLFTGTRAVRMNGDQLTFKDAILRSLCRLIPFEPFSVGFGPPWHDSITKTRVIKAR